MHVVVMMQQFQKGICRIGSEPSQKRCNNYYTFIESIFELTNTIDDSVDHTLGSLSFNMCDTINAHPQPARMHARRL
jgi:hypothetical protein